MTSHGRCSASLTYSGFQEINYVDKGYPRGMTRAIRLECYAIRWNSAVHWSARIALSGPREGLFSGIRLEYDRDHLPTLAEYNDDYMPRWS